MNREENSSGVRRLLGAPPSLSRGAAARTFAKIERIQPATQEECSDEESTTNAEEVEEEVKSTVHQQPEDGESSTAKKQKRRKRRIRLTDQGLKAKRKAERREKLIAEKKIDAGEEGGEMPDQEILAKSPTPKSNELDEVPEKKPTPEIETPFQLFCDNILRKLISKDPEGYFMHPVTELEAPNYRNVIECPMDFSTIREKIAWNTYTTLEEFKKDVLLISENAIFYNNPTSIYHLAAQKLALLTKYYFSEKYILYLFYTLPFGKSINRDQLGLKSRVNERQKTKIGPKKDDERQKILASALKDDQKMDEIAKQATIEIKDRLTNRKPSCHLAYLDNKDGAIALNVLTPATDETKCMTLGDLVKPLDKGNPGLCVGPFEPRICQDFLISYTNPGPYASFAPQFDTTWATLSKRDSNLLLSCYGDKDNVADSILLKQMVSNAGSFASSFVDSLLDDLTQNEHSETISQLEKPTIESESGPSEADDRICKTGKLIEELASMQHRRLSKASPPTLTEATNPNMEETQLAGEIVQRLGQKIADFGATPGDLISTNSVHQALGLDADDYNVLSEFLDV